VVPAGYDCFLVIYMAFIRSLLGLIVLCMFVYYAATYKNDQEFHVNTVYSIPVFLLLSTHLSAILKFVIHCHDIRTGPRCIRWSSSRPARWWSTRGAGCSYRPTLPNEQSDWRTSTSSAVGRLSDCPSVRASVQQWRRQGRPMGGHNFFVKIDIRRDSGKNSLKLLSSDFVF